MPSPRIRQALLAPALAVLALGSATSAATAADRHEQRLVLRGDATAVDGPCDARACRLQLAEGRFRGTPVGSGDYAGDLRIAVGDAFPNGEGGICAPLEGRIVLGAGTPDRLVLGLVGDSCQDGAGPLGTAAFTGLARFSVRTGSGRYAGARGDGVATLTEDAANHHRIVLVGRLGTRA
jgi:hypothetical protein